MASRLHVTTGLHSTPGRIRGVVRSANESATLDAVDYTVEYYTRGHLTKSVRSGAQRIASTASSSVPNVAWRNPDGWKALIAYNDASTARTVTINWGSRHATHSRPGKTSATFTWSGTQSGR